MSNTSDFILNKEDHTLGNLLSEHLKLHPNVYMAGYKRESARRPHLPLTRLTVSSSRPPQRPEPVHPTPDRRQQDAARGVLRGVREAHQPARVASPGIHSRMGAAPHHQCGRAGQHADQRPLGREAKRVQGAIGVMDTKISNWLALGLYHRMKLQVGRVDGFTRFCLFQI